MRSLSVELDDDTLEALEMERRLIGFDSREAYVQWILDNRASIADEGDGETTQLETYRERIAELEQQLAAATDGESEIEEKPDQQEQPSARNGGPAGQKGDRSRKRVRADGNGWVRSKSDSSVEVRGSPRTTVSPQQSTESPDCGAETSETASLMETETATDANGETATDAIRSEGANSDSEPESAYLPPERVVRIREDRVSEDANVLETVELDRLDELSRRAVAKTRSQLNRRVETGLEYRSSTTLVDETIRPGADVIDLDSLSVPGHDEEVIEARREVAGRAIAFLRDEGRARKSDFVDALYEPHPAGYETADSWWACLKRALKQVETIEGGDGRRVWRFRD